MKWNEKSFIEHLLFHTLITVQSLGIFVVLTQQKNKKLNELALHFIYQDKISTYETLFVKNRYSTWANQRCAKMLKQCLE